MPNGPTSLSQQQAFVELHRRGATHARVEFSGGNDEGGADRIVLLSGDEEIATVPDWLVTVDWRDGERVELQISDQDRRDVELGRVLAKPVHDKFGSFAGDFEVEGVVTWDVAQRTIHMTGQEQVWQETSFGSY